MKISCRIGVVSCVGRQGHHNTTAKSRLGNGAAAMACAVGSAVGSAVAQRPQRPPQSPVRVLQVIVYLQAPTISLPAAT